jgi:Arc/MetJ-type ribon-helix-helix transcriptional regulator
MMSSAFDAGMAQMVRTQVQLTEEQARGLRKIAAERGVSVSELIRQSVERTLAEESRAERWQRALSVMGRYRSEHTDVSTEHDKYLAEDFR